MANEKILVVDDDTNICELLRLYLTKEGYQVTTANDGEEGLEKFNQLKPDMVLLDVMMPRMDGLEVCRRIRKLGNTPVMMLTAKGETFDKVLGLELGADDYIVKPFEVLELLARVDVVLRRYNKTDAVIEIGGLRIDTRAMQVWRGAEEIALTHKEYDLLLFFARNPGTALYRETIYEHVWGGEYSYGRKTVDLHIQRLRKKVGWENRLLAVNKVGYRLEV